MLGVDPQSDALDMLPIDAGGDGPRRLRRRRGDRQRRLPRWSIPVVVLVAVAGVAALFLSGGDDASDDDANEGALEAGDSVDFGDLLDGQAVALLVDGLPASEAAVTVQCVAGGGDPDAGCDPTTATRSSTTATGALDAEVSVWRVISTSAHGTYDCARQPCELRTYPTQTAGPAATSSLGFDAQNTATLPPEVYTLESTPTADETVTVRATDLTVGSQVDIRGCSVGVDGDPIACEELWSTQITADERGVQYEIDPDSWHGVFETRCGAGCRIDINVAGLDRQPFSIHLPPSNRAGLLIPREPTTVPTELVVSPATDLVDGQEVTLEAAGLTNEMGLYLCTDSANFDCSWLGAPVTADTQTVRVPRAFVSWAGGLRDCAELSCEIVVLGPMNFEDRVAASVSFDASIPLAGGRPLSIDEDGLIADGQRVVLSIDPNEGAMEWPNMTVCARDRDAACEYVDGNFSDNAVTAVLYRTLMTPIGPYDCIDDGPCDLFVWIDGRSSRFEPVALEFDPDAPLAREPVSIAIRPRGPLSDGDQVSLTLRGLQPEDQVVFASICIAGEIRCAFLGPIGGGAGSSYTTTFRMPRIVTMESMTTPGSSAAVDCLEVRCEIRLGNVRAGEPAPLVFADEPPLPSPEVALGIAGALPTDEQIEVRGRRFTFISPNEGGGWIDIRLCSAGDAPSTYAGCYTVGGASGGQIDVDAGTFVTRIVVPANAPNTIRLPEDDLCDIECVLVVFDGAGPPGVIPVTIDR